MAFKIHFLNIIIIIDTGAILVMMVW